MRFWGIIFFAKRGALSAETRGAFLTVFDFFGHFFAAFFSDATNRVPTTNTKPISPSFRARMSAPQ